MGIHVCAQYKVIYRRWRSRLTVKFHNAKYHDNKLLCLTHISMFCGWSVITVFSWAAQDMPSVWEILFNTCFPPSLTTRVTFCGGSEIFMSHPQVSGYERMTGTGIPFFLINSWVKNLTKGFPAPLGRRVSLGVTVWIIRTQLLPLSSCELSRLAEYLHPPPCPPPPQCHR